MRVVNQTVQPQAVNLAHAEPCPNPAHGLFYCGPCPHGTETAQSPQRLRQRMAVRRQPSPTMNAIDLSQHSPKPLSDKPTEAEASGNATLRANGSGSRAKPWFEGAHAVRRCTADSNSAHLGKPRRFLRRCAAAFEDAHSPVRIFVQRKALSPNPKQRPKPKPAVTRLDAPTAPGPGQRPGWILGWERTEWVVDRADL
jgi:hypothetical protein